ncbi:hypothetical protein B6S44_16355 [Bosea sp. Tri-44]|uniref:hypothetical protein n=1 Tax=Bosea sp. Tri-44 TaxID=1972137 RepID=UPI00100DCADD|nr:hypothetical protein [Bosea sp. Tri-44]RXT53463.1 hypothetical protein B6S44_16355 [Bosea sp. Tri-44]
MTSNTLPVHHSAIELAAKAGPVGASVFDVAKLYVQTGILVYDAARRLIAFAFDLAIILDFIATFAIAGGSIIAIMAAGFGGVMNTGITPTQRSAVANGAVVGAVIMAMGLALTSFKI